MITPTQLINILECPSQRAVLWVPHINAAMERFDITTPLRVAAFLAQIGHESARLKYVREIWNPVQCPWQLKYDRMAGLGNTLPEAIRIAAKHGSTPGPWWKGRGLIQITGYSNHLACGNALGLSLLHTPELLEQPENAAASAAWFWATHDCNKYADLGDIDGVSDVINLGRKTARIGDANGYTDRLDIYQQALTVLLG